MNEIELKEKIESVDDMTDQELLNAIEQALDQMEVVVSSLTVSDIVKEEKYLQKNNVSNVIDLFKNLKSRRFHQSKLVEIFNNVSLFKGCDPIYLDTMSDYMQLTGIVPCSTLLPIYSSPSSNPFHELDIDSIIKYAVNSDIPKLPHNSIGKILYELYDIINRYIQHVFKSVDPNERKDYIDNSILMSLIGYKYFDDPDSSHQSMALYSSIIGYIKKQFNCEDSLSGLGMSGFINYLVPKLSLVSRLSLDINTMRVFANSNEPKTYHRYEVYAMMADVIDCSVDDIISKICTEISERDTQNLNNVVLGLPLIAGNTPNTEDLTRRWVEILNIHLNNRIMKQIIKGKFTGEYVDRSWFDEVPISYIPGQSAEQLVEIFSN